MEGQAHLEVRLPAGEIIVRTLGIVRWRPSDRRHLFTFSLSFVPKLIVVASKDDPGD
jgi:hypothetical protein